MLVICEKYEVCSFIRNIKDNRCGHSIPHKYTDDCEKTPITHSSYLFKRYCGFSGFNVECIAATNKELRKEKLNKLNEIG